MRGVNGAGLHPWRPAWSGCSARTERTHRRAVVRRPDVLEQHVLEAGPDRTHGQVPAGVLFDLDHPAEVAEQLDGPAQVVQVVHRPGRVLSDELDIVEVARLADQLGNSGPCGQHVSAEAGQTPVKEAHGGGFCAGDKGPRFLPVRPSYFGVA